MKNSGKSSSNMLVKEYIVTALIQLLKEKPLSAISISELTAKAGVSRMAYYRNYSSKEDIFLSHLSYLLDLYKGAVSKNPLKEEYYRKENLIHCFSHFLKYEEFLESLFKSGMGHFLLDTISSYVIEAWYRPEDGIERYYELQAFSGAVYNLYISWSSKGAKESPEQMAEILYHIYSQSFQ